MCCAGLSRSVSDSLQPCGLKPSRLLCPWGFSRQEYWSGLPCLPPGDLSKPGIEPRSPTLQVDSLLLGSLSLLQVIFPTQESNWGLLHCRRILYQLSYEGSPHKGQANKCFRLCRPRGPHPSFSTLSLQQRSPR